MVSLNIRVSEIILIIINFMHAETVNAEFSKCCRIPNRELKICDPVELDEVPSKQYTFIQCVPKKGYTL